MQHNIQTGELLFEVLSSAVNLSNTTGGSEIHIGVSNRGGDWGPQGRQQGVVKTFMGHRDYTVQHGVSACPVFEPKAISRLRAITLTSLAAAEQEDVTKVMSLSPTETSAEI